MKLNLLLFCTFMVFTSANAQVVSFADAAGGGHKKAELVRAQLTDEKTISIYPNPTSGIVNLSLSGFSGKKTALSVVNVIGTVVYRETINTSDNAITKTIDMRKNSNGLYYVKLEAEDYSEIRKVILK